MEAKQVVVGMVIVLMAAVGLNASISWDFEGPEYVTGQSIYLGPQPWLNGEWYAYGAGATGTVTATPAISGSKSAVQGPMYSGRNFENRAVVETVSWKMSIDRVNSTFVQGIFGYGSIGTSLVSVSENSDGRLEIASSARGYPVAWGVPAGAVVGVKVEIDYGSTFGSVYGDAGTSYHPVVVTLTNAGTQAVLFTNAGTTYTPHMFGIQNLTPAQVASGGRIGFLGEGAIFDDIVVIPEPATIGLLIVGGLSILRKRFI